MFFLSFLGPDGRCYKTLKIDPLVILKTQIESLLKKNRTATTEYDEDYDYSEYSESTESMNSNGQYTVPLSLGFSNDHRPIHLQQQQLQHEQRLQQQQQQQSQSYTTFPNLNRVVKDDSHITPNLHVSSEKENQPFLVSTTGLDLGSEDDDAEDAAVESKHETSSSGATASSMVPSSTRDAANTVEIEPSSTSSFIDESSSSTNPTTTLTNADATTLNGLPSQTTVVSTDPEEMTPTDQQLITPKSATDSKIKALPSDGDAEPLETTTALDEKIAPTTDQDRTMDTSTDPNENATPTNENLNKRHTAETQTINGSTEAVDATTMPTDEIDSTTISAQDDEATQSAQSDGDLNTQSSTNMPMDSIEQKPQKQEQNESSHDLPTLSQTREKLVEIESKDNDDDGSDPETTSAAPSNSTTTTNEPFIDPLMVNKTEANESNEDLIDAVFIPSQFDTLTDEMDPAVGKPVNNSTDDPSKFRLEIGSTSAVVDAELAEAEIAPIIDTGKKSPRANIEFIDNLDESAQIQGETDEDDEAKNLNARLADELLFLGIPKDPNAATASPPALPLSSLSPSLTVSKSETSKSIEKGSVYEETLNGAPPLGIGFNSDVTTEEPIDYDSNEANADKKSVVNFANSNSDSDVVPRPNANYDIASSENGAKSPFSAEKQLVEPPIAPVQQVHQQQKQNLKKPSVYSTFMNRLRYAPPIVDLSVDNNRRESTTGAVQYPSNPFDFDPTIQSANERYTPSSQPTIPNDDDQRPVDGSPPSTGHIDLSSGGRGITNRHQLQIGINCYLRNLGNKQQFIICDNA